MKYVSKRGFTGRIAIAAFGVVALIGVSYPAIALAQSGELREEAVPQSAADLINNESPDKSIDPVPAEEPLPSPPSPEVPQENSPSVAAAEELVFPSLPESEIYTGANQTSGVSVPVYGLEGIPADQPFMVQINPAGGTWETVDQKTAGEITAAESTVTIPRDKIPTAGVYYVQLSNWGLTPNYFGENKATPPATIYVLDLPMPTLISVDILRPQGSADLTVLSFDGLSAYPDDQVFTVNVAPSGGSTTHSERVTVGQLRGNQWKLSLLASYFEGGDAFFVEITNWGASPNYYDPLIRMMANVSVRDLSAPTLPQDTVFINEDALPEAVIFTLENLSTGIPDDQVFNVQYGPAGTGDGWKPVRQYTMGELRTSDGKIEIPRDLIDDGDPLFYIEITNWGMTPNYYPSDFILYGSIFIGDYSPPTFIDDLLYTYLDTIDDVEFQVGNLADLPDDQVLNVQMGLSGSTSGWEELGTITLGELRDSDGIITVPREKLTELGTYYVQITNWGMSPNYYPEIFTVGAAIRVEDSPSAAFYSDTGEPIESMVVQAGSPHEVNVGVSGFVPNGTTMVVQVYAEGEPVFTSDEIPLSEQFDFGTYSVTIPESILQAQFGEPNTSLGVIAFIQLPDEYAGAEVDPALLDLTVTALAPEISFDKPSYTVTSGKALDFNVRGLEELPADYPVELTLRSADGRLAWSAIASVADVVRGALTIPETVTKTLVSGEYSLTASVMDYYSQVTTGSASVTLTSTPVDPTGSNGKEILPGNKTHSFPRERVGCHRCHRIGDCNCRDLGSSIGIITETHDNSIEVTPKSGMLLGPVLPGNGPKNSPELFTSN